jgi:hypothetical protein
MRQYVYDYHGRRRLVLAHPQEPLLCVAIPADLFDEIRQWDAEALGQLREAIEEAIRTDARQRQTAATEAGTTADVGEQAGDASADLPESESPGNQESESPGNQERWT